MILPFSVVNFAGAQNTNEDRETKVGGINEGTETGESYQIRVDETKQDFKEDIKDLIDIVDHDDYQVKSDEIMIRYDEFFRIVIEQARVESQTGTLTDGEITNAIDYIFIETIKDVKYKLLLESNSSNKTEVSFPEWIGVQTVEAACPVTTHPNYKQLRLDINGGRHNGHSYNGDNDLYLVLYQDNFKTCERTYTLSFLDEDHPTQDLLYDTLRFFMYNRVFDIESFVIINNNQIKFPNTWSSSLEYDCGIVWHYPHKDCHNTTTKSYTPGQTIYVSNTWNHMMDTSNTNRGMSLVSAP